MPHAIQIPSYLDRLTRLKDWEVKRLSKVEISFFIGSLKNYEEELEEKRVWAWRWKSFLQRESDKRSVAEAEALRRQIRYVEQVLEVEERNRRLEEQYNRDTYAE